MLKSTAEMQAEDFTRYSALMMSAPEHTGPSWYSPNWDHAPKA